MYNMDNEGNHCRRVPADWQWPTANALVGRLDMSGNPLTEDIPALRGIRIELASRCVVTFAIDDFRDAVAYCEFKADPKHGSTLKNFNVEVPWDAEGATVVTVAGRPCRAVVVWQAGVRRAA